MNNCLVTKYKAVVNDDKLEKLGFIRFSQEDDVIVISLIAGNSPVIIRNESATMRKRATMAGEWTSIGPSYTLVNEGAYFEITKIGETNHIEISKYTLTGLGLGDESKKISTGVQLDISKLKFNKFTTLSISTVPQLTGKIEELNLEDITSIIIPIQKIEGDISCLSSSNNLTSVVLNQNLLNGNLESLGNCVKLATLRIQRNTAIIGTVENFVRNQCNSGRVSGTLACDLRYTKITLNGNVLENINSSIIYLVYSNNGCVIRDKPTAGNILATYIKTTGEWQY